MKNKRRCLQWCLRLTIMVLRNSVFAENVEFAEHAKDRSKEIRQFSHEWVRGESLGLFCLQKAYVSVFSPNYLGWLRKIAQKIHLAVCAHFAAEVSQAVGNNQVPYVKPKIVSGNLVENLLRDSYLRSFALDNQARIGLTVENNNIAAFLQAVVSYWVLCGHQTKRKTQRNKVLHNVLTNPLLRRQRNKLASQRVENLLCRHINAQLL